MTLTCPTLVSASHIICCVPGQRKAEAVKNALEGPVTPACPESIVRTHAQACLYLDEDSASLLAAAPPQVSNVSVHSETTATHRQKAPPPIKLERDKII